MSPELKVGQRWLYKSKSGGKFIAEVARVADVRHADMKVLHDIHYRGLTKGYIYSSMLVDDPSYWEYLPGQDAPANG